MRNEPWKYGVPKRIKDSNFTFTKLQQSSFSETFFCSTRKKNINKILMNINSPTLYCFLVICDHKTYAQCTKNRKKIFNLWDSTGHYSQKDNLLCVLATLWI